MYMQILASSSFS